MVEFYSHKDAYVAAHVVLQQLSGINPHIRFDCYWLTPKDMARACGQSIAQVSNHAGVWITKVWRVGPVPQRQVTPVEAYDLFNHFSPVKAFKTLPNINDHIKSFKVEFVDTRVDATALLLFAFKTGVSCPTGEPASILTCTATSRRQL